MGSLLETRNTKQIRSNSSECLWRMPYSWCVSGREKCYLASAAASAGLAQWCGQGADLNGQQEEREGTGGCDLYPFHYFQWQNAANKLVTAGFLGWAQSPVCVWLPHHPMWYLGVAALTSAHFYSNMQPVCHHSELAGVLSLFILFLHTGLVISTPQCRIS